MGRMSLSGGGGGGEDGRWVDRHDQRMMDECIEHHSESH